MSRTRKRRINLINAGLAKHEKRMTDAIARASSTLALEIDARWQPGSYTLIPENLTRFQRKMSSILFRYGIYVAGESGTGMLRHFSVKSSMDIMMESIRRWLRGYSDQRALIITQYLRTRIQDQLSSGQSDADIRSAIMRIINNKNSAARIARTETHIAMERGAYEAAQSLGIRIVKEWATVDDVLARPDHALVDGQAREIDEPFLVGGESLQHPGDPTASAKQVVNCRCTALYHLVVNGEIRR